MADFNLDQIRLLAHSVVRRARLLEEADPGPHGSLRAIGDGLMAEVEYVRS